MNDISPPRKKPSGLGRGLSALLGEIQTEAPVSLGRDGEMVAALPQGLRMVDIGGLRPMPNQPRKTFEDDALDELAQSILSRGMLQPIVVREARGDGHFEIIAGERRWRAAQRANLHQVPVIVKDFDDKTAFELAIIENVQREQLNAWEEGNSYARLIAEHDYTQDAVAGIVGKSRSHIANLIRLQNLPISVHGWLTAGRLTMGHARALLLCTDPEGVARQVIDRGLSVRETEALAKKSKPSATKTERANASRDPDLEALERQLGGILGLKVRIAHGGRGGTLTLGYSSLDQLDMICQRLSGEKV